MLFMSKDAKAQLEEYQAISEIVNSPGTAATKAIGLYELWIRRKSQTARNMTYLLLHHPEMKEWYDGEVQIRRRNSQNGVHIQYKQSYNDLMAILSYLYSSEDEKIKRIAELEEYAKAVPAAVHMIEMLKKTGK